MKYCKTADTEILHPESGGEGKVRGDQVCLWRTLVYNHVVWAQHRRNRPRWCLHVKMCGILKLPGKCFELQVFCFLKQWSNTVATDQKRTRAQSAVRITEVQCKKKKEKEKDDDEIMVFSFWPRFNVTKNLVRYWLPRPLNSSRSSFSLPRLAKH